MKSVLQLMISKVNEIHAAFNVVKNVDTKISDYSHTLRSVKYQIMKKPTKIFVLKQ